MKKQLLPTIFLITIIFLISCDNRNPTTPLFYFEYIEAEPDTIYADNNQTSSEIEVKLNKGNGDPAAGKYIYFETDIGEVLPYYITDEFGIAKSTLYDSEESGLATVTVNYESYYDSVKVMILELPEKTTKR